MKTKKRKLYLSILSLTTSLTLLGLVFSSTVAWYIGTREVSLAVFNIGIESPSIFDSSIKAYNVLSIQDSTYNIETDESVVVQLPRYDAQRIDYSKYEQVLVLEISFTSSEAKSYTFNAYAEYEDIIFFEGTTPKKENYLSS